MSSVNQNITKYLNYYVEIKNPQYAVLINGKWGSGKTFFIKNLIEEWSEDKKDQNENIKLKPIYVSLNGLSEVNQITLKIKEALNPLLYSKGAQVIKKVFFGVLKSAAHINLDIDGDEKSDGKVTFNIDSIGLLKNDNPKIKGQKILIFDDFERCKIQISELFGYLNEFVEHHKCKVVILADEHKVFEASSKNEEKITYKDFKEKLIGQTFTLEVELDKALDLFIKTSNSDALKCCNNIIKQIFFASEIQNLRILKQVICDFDRFILQIDEKIRKHDNYQLFLKNLLGHFLLVYLEYKGGNHSISNLVNYNITNEQKEFESKIISKYNLIFIKYELLHRKYVIPYKQILKFLKNGYCDKEEFNHEIKGNSFFKDQEEEDWVKLYSWEELDDDEFDIVYKTVFDDLKQKKFNDPYKLTHVITILLSLIDSGIISESKSEINEFFEKTLNKIFRDNSEKPFSKLDVHSYGKGYRGKDSSYFKKIEKFFNDKVTVHNSCQKDNYLKNLFEGINDDSLKNLIDRLNTPLPDGSSTYNYVPILSTVNGEILAKKLLKLKARNLDIFFYIIEKRYHKNGNLESYNSEDKGCLIAIRDHFIEELENFKRIRKHNISKRISFLDELIEELENLSKNL
ncbi:P-loop NTPase fold protein [Zobellia nedashkovskayae]